MLQYLVDRNDVSLHLLLCSSSRSLLTALCRRMMNVEALSQKAHEHYQLQKTSGRPHNLQLQLAYDKMKRVTDANIINIKALEKALNTVSNDMRQAYAEFLPRLVKSQPNPPQGKEIDTRVRAAQSQSELVMFLCSAPAVAFFPIIKKILDTELRTLRDETDAAKLYFANYDLVEVQDDRSSLDAKVRSTTHVDVFRRINLGASPRRGQQWRRCTRCAAVMEDVFGSRPGLTFLLNQQRKCSCGGFWSLMPPGKL
jgi:mediator of RNA polymerase II transcription subunit 16, fungi type